MLFNEPKLLKSIGVTVSVDALLGFSALQRAEIAEMSRRSCVSRQRASFSALQRAEIAEIQIASEMGWSSGSFSALQRAEIAEI